MFPFKTNIAINRTTYAVWLLIIANIVIFFYFRFHFHALLFADHGFMPLKLSMPNDIVNTNEKIASFFTYMFLHSSFLHVFINMYFLYIFGRNIEDKLGSIKFLCLYILLGVIAVIIEAFLNPKLEYPIVGASGAVTGIMGVFLVFFPYAKIKTFIFLLIYGIVRNIHVIVIIILFFASQLIMWYIEQRYAINEYLYNIQNNIVIEKKYIRISYAAYFTHLGGFFAGIIFGIIYKLMNKKKLCRS